MKTITARFSLFLIMMVGIAGSSFVQGTPSESTASVTDCIAELTSVAADLEVRGHRRGGATTRPVRWQSLLPGAFH